MKKYSGTGYIFISPYELKLIYFALNSLDTPKRHEAARQGLIRKLLRYVHYNTVHLNVEIDDD